MKYNSNLFYITALRSRIAVITNTVLALTCVITATVTEDEVPKRVLYGVAISSSVNGLLARKSQDAHQKAQEDVADISDQVRTNDIYNRLQGQEGTDLSGQVFTYLVEQSGRGKSKDEMLRSLHTDRAKALQLWSELEQRYGKIPTGEY